MQTPKLNLCIVSDLFPCPLSKKMSGTDDGACYHFLRFWENSHELGIRTNRSVHDDHCPWRMTRPRGCSSTGTESEVAICSCNDGLRPVIFRLEAADE